MKLRPYQLDAIQRVHDRLADRVRSLLLVAPTGSGKTVIAAELARQFVETGRRVMFMAPRRELIAQASSKLRAFGIRHGRILAGDEAIDLAAPVQVASIDTLRTRGSRLVFPDPHVVLVDEAHLYVTAIRVALLNRWPDAARIGLTATPCRKDGRGLGTLFAEMIEVASVAELTTAGHLVPGRYYSLSEPDLDRVSTVAGDYHQGQLADAVAPLVADIPRTWLQLAPGRRTVVFAVSVQHSVALRDAFLREGVAAEHVDGATPIDERAAIFDRFTRGETEVLVNCQLATYGFDLPELDCVVLARPTKSLAMYLQMIGRGLRPAPGKSNCLVLDHSGAVHRFGFATEDRGWSLDGHRDLTTAKRERERGEGRDVTCPECSCVFRGRECPSCSWYAAPKGREITTLDGELIEIGEHLPEDEQARLTFYLELRGYQHEVSRERELAGRPAYKDGWAAVVFKEKHGDWPPRPWGFLPPAQPSLETRRWIKSRNIAFAKSREPARRFA